MAACARWTRNSRKVAVLSSFQNIFRLIPSQFVILKLQDEPRCFYQTTTAQNGEYNDEDIDSRRDKSRIKSSFRRLMDAHSAMPDILFDYQLTPKYRSRLYAKHGRESGVDPGIMWPTREKLQSMIEHEKEFEPELKELMTKVEKNQREAKEAVIEREKQVERNLGQLDKWMSEIKVRRQKKLGEIRAQQEKKERLIEEVRQYFGYRLLPKDPKFQEIVEKKEKEEKKAAKEAKKKERFAKEMAKLANLGQTAVGPVTSDKPDLKEKYADSVSSDEKPVKEN